MHGRRAALHRRHRSHLRPDPAPPAGRLPGNRRCGAAAATIARAAIAATFDRRWIHDGDAWRVALPCTDARTIGACRSVRATSGATAIAAAGVARSDRYSAAPWRDPWTVAGAWYRTGRRDRTADAAEDQAWCGQRAMASTCSTKQCRSIGADAELRRGPGSNLPVRALHADPNDRVARSAGCCTTGRRALGAALCRCESDADL